MMKKSKNIPSGNPFKVPDNYFEEVNRKIISVTTLKEKEVKNPGIYRRLRPYFLIAASISGFIIISYFTARYFMNDKSYQESQELFAVTLTEPLINNIDIFLIEESALLIEVSDELTGIKNSELIDYLMLEDIEINDIYELL